MSVISEEKRKKMFRKKRYYNEHPNEALEDHLKQIKTGSDDFIMKKIEAWEKNKRR